MEGFDIPLPDPEKERLEKLAERALAFAGTVDLVSHPNLHIYRALDAERVMDQATRQRLIPEIKKILQWYNRPLSEREHIDVDAAAMDGAQPRISDQGATT